MAAQRQLRVVANWRPQIGTVLQRWRTLVVELARRLVGGPLHPEILTRVIEKNVSMHVNNVTNSEPVRKAWAGRRKNLSVHGLVYELETAALGILKSRRKHGLK